MIFCLFFKIFDLRPSPSVAFHPFRGPPKIKFNFGAPLLEEKWENLELECSRRKITQCTSSWNQNICKLKKVSEYFNAILQLKASVESLSFCDHTIKTFFDEYPSIYFIGCVQLVRLERLLHKIALFGRIAHNII